MVYKLDCQSFLLRLGGVVIRNLLQVRQAQTEVKAGEMQLDEATQAIVDTSAALMKKATAIAALNTAVSFLAQPKVCSCMLVQHTLHCI